jgi:hypothetical protein
MPRRNLQVTLLADQKELAQAAGDICGPFCRRDSFSFSSEIQLL